MHVVLLDRDGTVIAEPDDERVDTEAKIKLFPDTIDALRHLADHGFGVIFVTNQAGIAEGRISKEDFDRIHTKVLELLAPSGIQILGTYMCPHNSADNCTCRKPKPTMLIQAAQDFSLQLGDVYMVGDRPSDVEAGTQAGAKTVLISRDSTTAPSTEATYTAPNLLEAALYITSQAGNSDSPEATTAV